METEKIRVLIEYTKLYKESIFGYGDIKMFSPIIASFSEKEVLVVVSERFPRVRATRQTYSLSFFDQTGIELSFSDKLYWEGVFGY